MEQAAHSVLSTYVSSVEVNGETRAGTTRLDWNAFKQDIRTSSSKRGRNLVIQYVESDAHESNGPNVSMA